MSDMHNSDTTDSPLKRVRKATTVSEEGTEGPLDRAAVDRAIAEMAAKITDARSVGEAQKSQLAVIDSLLRPRSCFIAQYNSARNLLNIEAVRGRNDPRIAAAHPNEGPVGRCFGSGLVVREDSLVAVPVQERDIILGVLVVISPRHELPDELLKALAAQVAAAAEVARQRDEGLRRNRELETAVAGLKSEERKREELLSNISHELKNPLTTIKTYLAMLRRETYGPMNEKQQRAVDICDRNSDRLLRLINDLLLVSRLRGGEMKLNERPFGIRALTEDIVQQQLRTAEQAKVVIAPIKGSETFVRGDRERLAEAISNVLETAIFMSPPSQAVTVSVGTDDAGLAVLDITTRGEGIRPDVLQELFDSFYRVKSAGRSLAGSGLGLPIASKIVELHGGRLEVDSKPSDTTSFRMYLPLFAGAVAPMYGGKGPRQGPILIVEDDPDCRDVLEEVLVGEGYPVRSAHSAETAIEALRAVRPSLVLLDLRLADSDGRAVLHFIRNDPELKGTVVYIVSGASDAAQLTVGQGQDRIDGLFEKPLQLTKLLGTVAALVESTKRAE